MSETINPPGIPTVAEIDQITGHADPVVRNLLITQCYHELSSVLAARTGLSANWCTFATWASKQAGQTIRKEDLERALARIRSERPEIAHVASVLKSLGVDRDLAEIRKIVWEVLDPGEAVVRASEAVGRGNLKVFSEIGREFARFYAMLLQDGTMDPGRIQEFCDGLRPGDPPDGQEYLRRAFTCYYQVLFENDPKVRAELLLLASVEVGFHEQTRLQPEIAEALDAAVPDPEEVLSRLLKRLFPFGGLIVRARLFVTRLFGGQTPLQRAVGELVRAVRRHVRMEVTEHLMTIGLPGGKYLRLGEDLTIGFPPSLRELSNHDLRDLLARVDPTPDSLRDSGAIDWTDLPDRIHFIVDMFRCYQENRTLLDPPFTQEQVAVIKAGRRPDGVL